METVQVNNPAVFNQVAENTQNSVFLQKEIEVFATEVTTGKNLTAPGNALMTHRVHDQRTTNLCVSFSTMTAVRGAAMNYLVNKGANQDQLRNELENDNQFSFNKMLTLFTGCVSPRSLDGLIINSKNDAHLIDAQTQLVEVA